MNAMKFGKVFGWILLIIGVLGFVPGITTDMHLLGIFHVDAIHNIIHILTGIVGIVISKSDMSARKFFRVFGIIYAIVTIVGFVQGTTVLGIFGINMADNILHLVITVVALAIGFGGKKGMAPSAPMNQGM